MKRKTLTRIGIIVVAFSLLLNSTLLFIYLTDYKHLGRALRLTLLIKAMALRPVSMGQIIDSATGGIVRSLQDPYSEYLWGDEFDRFKEQIEGSFGGLGLILDTTDENQLKVQGVISGSPADRAGIRKGDLITAVDGQAVAQVKAMPAADLLKGSVGSEVALSVIRSKGVKRSLKLKREIINIKSVEVKTLKIPQTVAHIKINSFNEHTAEDLAARIEKLPQIQGILLDLRDNPGGSLEAAVEAANYFVPKGPVVHLLYRDGKRETYSVQGQKLEVPMVVLVNQGTASAAEILAAAMQDTASGLIVGSKTYGKGVVQTIYELGGDSALKLTSAKYLSPLGKDINKIGIQPDVTISDNENEEQVLSEALKLLAQRL